MTSTRRRFVLSHTPHAPILYLGLFSYLMGANQIDDRKCPPCANKSHRAAAEEDGEGEPAEPAAAEDDGEGEPAAADDDGEGEPVAAEDASDTSEAKGGPLIAPPDCEPLGARWGKWEPHGYGRLRATRALGGGTPAGERIGTAKKARAKTVGPPRRPSGAHMGPTWASRGPTWGP
eukprot:9479514-Pyramimonas_sp.AAC.1